MTTITGLGLALLVLMVPVGGKQGWTVFLSLFLSFGFLYSAIILVVFHVFLLFVTVTIGTTTLVITIFMGEGDLQTIVTAFYALLIVLCLILVLIFIAEHRAMVQGFGTEDSDELEETSILVGISYFKISVTITILSSLGAIAEMTMVISSGLTETLKSHPERINRQLIHSGMTTGQQIIGITFNMPFSGFFGGFLALFVWFLGLHYPFGTIMNNKIFVAEMIEILLSFTGALTTVPTIAWAMTKHRKSVVDNYLKTR